MRKVPRADGSIRNRPQWKVSRGGYVALAIPVALFVIGLVLVIVGLHTAPSNCPMCTGSPGNESCPTIACEPPVEFPAGIILMLASGLIAIPAVAFYRSRRYVPIPP